MSYHTVMNFSECLHDSWLLMTVPEMIAVITGIASVLFARRENILVYPVGIISVLLYVYICLEVKLYADSLINFYYFLVSIYGWYYWKRGGAEQRRDAYREGESMDSVYLHEERESQKGEEAEISWNSLMENLRLLFLTICIAVASGYILDRFTDSNVPYWDGSTTAIFCVAMWLMARKKIENWIFWLIGDAMSIPLYLYKHLCFSSLQYLVFTILAMAGYLEWYRRVQKKITAP